MSSLTSSPMVRLSRPALSMDMDVAISLLHRMPHQDYPDSVLFNFVSRLLFVSERAFGPALIIDELMWPFVCLTECSAKILPRQRALFNFALVGCCSSPKEPFALVHIMTQLLAWPAQFFNGRGLEAFNAIVQEQGCVAVLTCMGNSALPCRHLLSVMSPFAWGGFDRIREHRH